MNKRKFATGLLAVSLGGGLAAQSALAEISLNLGGDQSVVITGYLREHIAMNTANQIEGGETGDIAMARSTAYIQADTILGNWGYATVIWRGSREVETDYLENLNDAPGQAGDLMGVYNENEFREWYIDTRFAGWDMRLGRQQIAWGETDSFQALDVINGFDLRWRAGLEAENEELRKPLIMANLTRRIEQLNGSLQLLYRPGWDQDDDMGNSLPLEGGRWGLNGSRNVNALGFVPVNYDHSKGDTDDPSYGFRWSGKFGDVGYTLNYYHTLNDNPVVNSAFSGLPGVFAYGDAPTSAFGEFIFPEIDILGGSLNAYSRKLDVVFRGELAYTLDKPYNVGYAGSSSLTAFETGVLMLPAGSLPAGSLGIIEKDTARIMIGLDKTNLQTMRLLGTSQPSFLTFQLFDTWLPDFEDSEQLVNGSSKLHEHSVTGSVALGLNYKFDTVQPGAAFIYDFTNGGGAFVPSLNLIYGDHWRVKFTGTVYYQSDHTCGAADPTCTNSFGVFDDSDQVDVRVTYQF